MGCAAPVSAEIYFQIDSYKFNNLKKHGYGFP